MGKVNVTPYSRAAREALAAARSGKEGVWLTQAQAVPRKLPLAGIIGQVLALVFQGHLAGVHDDGEVACLDVCMGWLQESANTKSEEDAPLALGADSQREFGSFA